MTERVSWLIVASTTILLPLVVSVAAKDSFRAPKDLILRASGILLLAMAICEVILEGRLGFRKQWPRYLLGLMASILTWCVVITLTSTNRALSLGSLLSVGVAAVFFAAVYRTVQGRSLSVLYVIFIPALINALIAISQRTGIWAPYKLDDNYTGRLATTGLMGNPDDVGMFLFAPTLAAVALAVVSRRHRWTATGIAVILTIAVAASETAGALIPIAAGVFLLLLRVRPRTAIISAVLCVLLAGAALRLSPVRWANTRSHLASASHGDIDPFLSGRLPAFLAAWRMFRQHPVLGVGLGCFSFHYYEEKIAVEMEHPWLLNRSVVNFGEAHSEHLQILAEGGLPGYAVFCSVLVALALISFRRPSADDSSTMAFAQLIAFPFAAGFFLLALSSFPLHLAAPTTNLLFLSAVTMAWADHARR